MWKCARFRLNSHGVSAPFLRSLSQTKENFRTKKWSIWICPKKREKNVIFFGGYGSAAWVTTEKESRYEMSHMLRCLFDSQIWIFINYFVTKFIYKLNVIFPLKICHKLTNKNPIKSEKTFNEISKKKFDKISTPETSTHRQFDQLQTRNRFIKWWFDENRYCGSNLYGQWWCL